MTKTNETNETISCTSQHEVQARNGGVALRSGTDHVMLVTWERANVEKNIDDVIVRMTPDQARDAAALLTAYADFMEKHNADTEALAEQAKTADVPSILDSVEPKAKRNVKSKPMSRARKTELQKRSVLRAIENGCIHVQEIVESTRYSASTVRRVAKQLAAEGKITAKMGKRWDSQVGYAANMFGGAGVCIRHFWVFSPVKSA